MSIRPISTFFFWISLVYLGVGGFLAAESHTFFAGWFFVGGFVVGNLSLKMMER